MTKQQTFNKIIGVYYYNTTVSLEGVWCGVVKIIIPMRSGVKENWILDLCIENLYVYIGIYIRKDAMFGGKQE